MSRYALSLFALLLAAAGASAAPTPENVSSLRLVPFPKEVRRAAGVFALDRPLVLEVPAEAAGAARPPGRRRVPAGAGAAGQAAGRQQ